MDESAYLPDISRARVIRAPSNLCIYVGRYRKNSLSFFDSIDKAVLEDFVYVKIDMSAVKEITAAAALIFFAKITRCQCCAPQEIFRFRDRVVDLDFGDNEIIRKMIIKAGLWAAIRPGGEKKLERLWEDGRIPYKSGSNPADEIDSIIEWLQGYRDPLPRKMISALQEAYLNIAHHAYEKFKVENRPLVDFMMDRWWQYSYYEKSEGRFSVILYDMGAGIPDTARQVVKAPSDNEAIERAMVKGFTRTGIAGRGLGSDDMQKPIRLNEFAEYLFVYSGKGLVVYDQSGIQSSNQHDTGISGTLLEWTFGEAKDG